MLYYTVPASAMSWYGCSLSYALHLVAQSGNGVFPRALSSELEHAGRHVFAHECYFNDKYAGGHALDPDPMFAYNGYLKALTNLLKIVGKPARGSNSAYICLEIQGHLQSILLIAHSRCTNRIPLDLTGDREWNLFLADFAQALKP